MKKLFSILLKTILGLLTVFLLFFFVVSFFAIPIHLNKYKSPVEVILTKALNRTVKIEKDVVITTSLSPTFTIGGVRINNLEGFNDDTFMYLDKAQIQIELLPLLGKKAHINKIKVDKLQLNLEETNDGKVNWAANPTKTATPEPKKTPKNNTPAIAFKDKLQSDTIVIKDLDIKDISVKYISPNSSEPSRYSLENLTGSMLSGKPFVMDLDGNFQAFPYKLNISINSIEEFLLENKTGMTIQADIAETNLEFSGNVDLAKSHRAITLDAKISSDNLNNLNELLILDLPPLSPYAIATTLYIKEKHYECKNLVVQVGDSRLQGTALLERGDEFTKMKVDFSSENIQLNDFIFENWSVSKGEEKNDEVENTEIQEEQVSEEEIATDKTVRKLIDPDLLEKFDAELTVQAKQVLIGDEHLGGGNMNFALRDGRMAIEPLHLDLPGGAIDISLSLKPGLEDSEAKVSAKVENFDIGILARRKQPDTKMAGLVNIDTNLTSSASTAGELLANGNGYFDFSGNLQNIKAGLVDLWAVNLLSAIVTQTDENQSQINCAVCRWTVTDGILTPDVFFIDTSKIRICGKGEVDFKTSEIDLTISPTPKRPEFFNLATPLKVKGNFSDINMKVKGVAIVGTAISFITSPVHVPIRRMAVPDIPADGGDVCLMELGPDNRDEADIAGCRN